MDRLTRTLAGCGLALIAAAGGCRSAHDDVPPGRAYRPDGRQEAAVGFSTAQPDKSYSTPTNMGRGNVGGGGLMGSQPPGGDQTGTFQNNQFGAPGTSGAAAAAATASPSASLAPPPQTGAYAGLGQAPALGQPTAGAATPRGTTPIISTASPASRTPPERWAAPASRRARSDLSWTRCVLAFR